jgi:IPT/TIG domain
LRTYGADGQGAGAGEISPVRRAAGIAVICGALWLPGAALAAIAAPTALASAPAVIAISPNNGPAGGGSAVTITGSGFLPGSTISFGAYAATRENVESPSTITATSPAGAETVSVTVTNAEGSSAPLPGDRFAYDPVPHGPWLGLDGNSAGAWTGAIGDFTFHHIVYDRGGDPGLDWYAGQPLEEGGQPTAGGAALARSVAAGMIPDINIEYPDYTGDGQTDPNFPASDAEVTAYVEGFVSSARAIHERYPGAIFEPMNEPWFYTTPQYNGAEYADVIARLLPAARASGIPLGQIYVAAYGADRNANGELAGGWVPAMYGAQPQLQTEIEGWYFHPYGPPKGSGLEKSAGIQSLPEVQRLMTSGQNNIIVSEVGYCAPDVSPSAHCSGLASVESSTQAAERLTEMLDSALPYRQAGWLRALIVYSRSDGGWAMETPDGRLTEQGEALDEFADRHGLTSVAQPAEPSPRPDLGLVTVSCLTAGEHDPFSGPCGTID